VALEESDIRTTSAKGAQPMMERASERVSGKVESFASQLEALSGEIPENDISFPLFGSFQARIKQRSEQIKKAAMLVESSSSFTEHSARPRGGLVTRALRAAVLGMDGVIKRFMEGPIDLEEFLEAQPQFHNQELTPRHRNISNFVDSIKRNLDSLNDGIFSHFEAWKELTPRDVVYAYDNLAQNTFRTINHTPSVQYVRNSIRRADEWFYKELEEQSWDNLPNTLRSMIYLIDDGIQGLGTEIIMTPSRYLACQFGNGEEKNHDPS